MILGRCLAGMGEGLVMTNTYIFLMNLKEKEKWIGRFEASMACGFMLGPVLGSTFYAYYGFILTNLLIGSLSFLSLIIAFFGLEA
jgi:MFS family permease